jgi:isopentenyl-diphosphate delta-isomerase
MSALIPAWVGGVLTPVDKMAVHRRGLRHKAISVFVMRAGQILLQRRALGKYHTPGLWANTCCTHPHWGEDDLTCATRRLDEELGIRDLTLREVREIEYRADVGADMVEHEVVRLFVAEAPAGMAPEPNPDEVCDTRWIDAAALKAELARWPERFTPWLRIYMRDHSDALAPA